MDALRAYLQAMPNLSTKLLEQLADLMSTGGGFDYNNAEEMRAAYAQAQQTAMAHLVEAQSPYYVITYPQISFKCPTCSTEVRGAYYEVSNPITTKRGMFRARSFHEFLEHGGTSYREPILNVSETLIGHDEHHLDVKKLATVLDGLPLPGSVLADLRSQPAA